jgi:glutamine synthetase
MDKETVLEIIREKGIESVRFQFCDLNGIMRGRAAVLDNIENALENGLTMNMGTMDFTSFDQFAFGHRYGVQSEDFTITPDFNTFAVLPFTSKSARIFCDRLVKRYNELEFFPQVGFETEYYVLEEYEDGNIAPANYAEKEGHGMIFAMSGQDEWEEFYRTYCKTLTQMGIDATVVTKEGGPAQMEVNIHHYHPVKAADNQIAFMDVARELARQFGYRATFLPKPFQHLFGSGMHLHISLYDLDGQNLFYDPNEPKGHNLSEKMYYFIGGLLKHANAITAVGACTVNSYKRLLPHTWSPINNTWGINNRSTLIRIPLDAKEQSMRLEFRSPDPACNVYLVLAAILACGLKGIEEQIEPQKPSQEDASDLSEEELSCLGAKMLPRTLFEALEELKKDTVIKETFGKTIFEEFLKVKMTEWITYREYVTDWERRMYMRAF